MASVVTCPACHYRSPASGPACPRCGAPLPRTEVRPADGNILGAPPAPAALATTACPACGKAVPELCLLCPHCEGPLAERHRVAAAEEGGWKGRRPFRAWLVPLATVGAIAVLLTLLPAAAAIITWGALEARVGALFLLLLLVLLIAFAAPLLPRADVRSAGGWERLLVGTLAKLGCLVSLVVAAGLALGTVSAAVKALHSRNPKDVRAGVAVLAFLAVVAVVTVTLVVCAHWPWARGLVRFLTETLAGVLWLTAMLVALALFMYVVCATL
jgi:hypothetical protein